MIVFYNDNGEIKGTIRGNYKLSRHNLENRQYIEVEEQPLKNKKVDVEKQELVEVTS